MEELTCCECGKTWTRKIKQGPKPPRCSACKEKHLAAKRSINPVRHCFDCGDPLNKMVNKTGSDGQLRCGECGQSKRRKVVRSDAAESTKRITCKRCSKELEGAQRYWCSKTCAEIAYGQRRSGPRLPRKCLVCSEEFVPNSEGQQTCPPSEWERARAKYPDRITSWCHRRYYRFKRGDHESLTATPPRPFICPACGKHCVPGENGTHITARKFCGNQGCKAKYFHELTKNGCSKDQWFVIRGPACDVSKHKQPTKFIARYCLECGKAIVWPHQSNPAKYCGKKCKRKPCTRRRRLRFQNSFVETVHLQLVAERNQFKCGICGGSVDMQLPAEETFAPTLDHIFPLAFGGKHSYSNGQLAHSHCNSVKGAFEGFVLEKYPWLTAKQSQEWVRNGLKQWRNKPDSVAEIMARGGVSPLQKSTITGLGGISGSVRILTPAQGFRPSTPGEF